MKDALTDHSRLIRTVGQCAQTWWPWRLRYTRERKCKAYRSGRPGYWASRKARGMLTVLYHTCFESLLASTFVWSESVAFATSRCSTAANCEGCGHRYEWIIRFAHWLSTPHVQARHVFLCWPGQACMLMCMLKSIGLKFRFEFEKVHVDTITMLTAYYPACIRKG